MEPRPPTYVLGGAALPPSRPNLLPLCFTHPHPRPGPLRSLLPQTHRKPTVPVKPSKALSHHYPACLVLAFQPCHCPCMCALRVVPTLFPEAHSDLGGGGWRGEGWIARLLHDPTLVQLPDTESGCGRRFLGSNVSKWAQTPNTSLPVRAPCQRTWGRGSHSCPPPGLGPSHHSQLSSL